MNMQQVAGALCKARNDAFGQAERRYRAELKKAWKKGSGTETADAMLVRRKAAARNQHDAVLRFAETHADDSAALRNLVDSLRVFGLKGTAHDVLTEHDIEVISTMCGEAN